MLKYNLRVNLNQAWFCKPQLFEKNWDIAFTSFFSFFFPQKTETDLLWNKNNNNKNPHTLKHQRNPLTDKQRCYKIWGMGPVYIFRTVLVRYPIAFSFCLLSMGLLMNLFLQFHKYVFVPQRTKSLEKIAINNEFVYSATQISN